ncbi:V-type ATP synthase subunit F [Gudongella oleilytica]|jgi:V/A-type H+-transporting ATPase subunit F|uniref:V-type ATP synthase subunit F n=1 Tax=Gudongella oleilytica TaxID=1582259 RepID=UPI000EDAD105|nr:V-type ATP synthase subunit F [Gudongella oleilytica]MDY0255940.1 V-type ATP synthase subunit F [Gudongella oleilytica]HCO18878.1 V-type ATP synthase subunit F [Tissierellales bacterium]HMM70358.1 V-type ATP synthase subunit F [Gudongella oleilytica]
MYKVGVVGDKDSVLAFKALGVDVNTVTDREEARRIVDTMARSNYGVIFITEQIASLIPDTIERYDKEIIPAVILIPSNQGSLNIGMNRINENVEKAVGSNIL